MRLILSLTMILTTALAAGCGSDVSTGAGGGGTGATSAAASGSGGESSGTTSAASTSTGTGVVASKALCNSCIEIADPFSAGACGDKGAACENDGPCAAWLGCTDECFHNDWTPACFSACDAASAGAKSLYEPLYPCACAPCADECGFLCD